MLRIEVGYNREAQSHVELRREDPLPRKALVQKKDTLPRNSKPPI